ncbi:MAG: hypothetical protein AB7O31_15785 [Burkholderiales bacterium]
MAKLYLAISMATLGIWTVVTLIAGLWHLAGGIGGGYLSDARAFRMLQGILGFVLVWLALFANCWISATAAALFGLEDKAKAAELARRGMEKASGIAQSAQGKAQQLAERVSQVASQVAPRGQSSPGASLSCPGCKAGVLESDVFCGRCGHRLRQPGDARTA